MWDMNSINEESRVDFDFKESPVLWRCCWRSALTNAKGSFESGKFTLKITCESGKLFTTGCRLPSKSTNFGTLRQRCLCKLHVCCASQQAPPSSRGRNRSISASPIPIGPAVRTLFAKKAKNEDCANRHVPSATDRFPIGTIIIPRSKHIDQCLSRSVSTSAFVQCTISYVGTLYRVSQKSQTNL